MPIDLYRSGGYWPNNHWGGYGSWGNNGWYGNNYGNDYYGGYNNWGVGGGRGYLGGGYRKGVY